MLFHVDFSVSTIFFSVILLNKKFILTYLLLLVCCRKSQACITVCIC